MRRFFQWATDLWHLVWTPKSVREVVSNVEAGAIPMPIPEPPPPLDSAAEAERLRAVRRTLDRVEQNNRTVARQAEEMERLFRRRRESR